MASHEVLLAFVQAATQGSFSAAARKLGKSQSTISAAVASLEIDLDLQLFDRSSRKPALTPQGHVMLQRAEDILAATSRLEMAASQLAQGVEAKLTVALSDTYQSDRFETSLSAFEQRYPDLELECLIAECDDLIELVQRGRAQIAFAEMQPEYPADLDHSTVDERTEIALFVSRNHPLAVLKNIDQARLQQHRELRLATIVNPYDSRARGRVWSAPSYLMLLEMAQGGFGWAPLPRWLVERFGADSLVELDARGWPRNVAVDALWSRLHPPGPAGSWLLGRMLE
ncbi:DNA-binding transcriptional LysR family regulator [Pseudomonas chlororaphis]|jgi:DNA-binding transcriptional LysR family regulator|uniref:LysR family transcriptional regulator n=1 Tax=Pseudomonas TaxID=286 RepID=UPI000BDAF5A3|nr:MULTISPECIES: LysR family transcriptional regulator [Pseudomonas]MCP1483310.1 DNA-binding transcriptional LysR family regulator [Pseudomonas chlororaphis]MCP1596333.1 DNA-binding transcriptional LysR family regulator [Pseudomonas chlororaphis]PXX74275.1 DNA-binding transcriptional LysR family regulator [Pseudomonas sp. LAMO17WK12:I9]WDH33975.1 LysR family transcriptional regulator [Pseudomonas chlororaphis]WDH40059.1 LysR family transcriptional regulator [Pseudomonas chlororaphis]